MLTKHDYISLRNLLHSDKVTYLGNEVSVVMDLTAKLNAEIARLTEQEENGDLPTVD